MPLLDPLKKNSASNKSDEETPTIQSVADRYFKELSGILPTVSASDEFYFFPHLPAEDNDTAELIEDLDPEGIGELVSRLRGYLGLLSQIDGDRLDAEGKIDLALVRGNVSSAVRELSDSPDDYPIWLRDPAFPLTILMESLTRIGDRDFVSDDGDTVGSTLRLLKGGQRLIENSSANLTKKKNRPDRHFPSPVALDTARKMTGDCIDFIGGPYLEMVEALGDARRAEVEIGREASRLVDALGKYREAMDGAGFSEDISPGVNFISRVLRESYGEERGVDEIEEMGREGLGKGLERLEDMGRGMSKVPGGGWRDLYKLYFPPNFFSEDLISTYSSEINRIRGHLEKTGMVDPGWAGELVIDEVPRYLRSVRSAAAYSAPPPSIMGKAKKPGVFYIIPSFPGGGEGDADELRRSHREFIFMTAHETYPGHHLLDGVRTSLTNKIRSRIESPLFYEGWACYSETLLLDSGYHRGTEDGEMFALQLARRDAWRWARLLIDIGLNRSTMTIDKAAALLEDVGRPKARAKMEALRIAVTPGYQLTYALGKHEFMRLRDRYMENLGAKGFHRTLLFGGEIPFRHVEARLKAEIEKSAGKGES